MPEKEVEGACEYEQDDDAIRSMRPSADHLTAALLHYVIRYLGMFSSSRYGMFVFDAEVSARNFVRSRNFLAQQMYVGIWNVPYS